MQLKIKDKFFIWDEVDSRYFLFTGGRGSGKSYAVNTSLLLLTQESGHTILFTRYTLRSAAISIIPEFKEKIDLLGLNNMFKITRDQIVNIKSGSKIIFRGIKTSSGDQTANLKSLQGLTTWVMDEAEELMDENTFDKIDLSIRKKGMDNRVMLILNPTTKEHWIYKKFYQNMGVNPKASFTKDDVTYVHSTYLDNIENLSDSYIKRIEEMKHFRPAKYEHQILGGWLDKAEGVVFTNWKLGKFKQVGTIVLGQDFGFSADPTSLVKTSIDKSNKIIYVELCYYKTQLTTSQILDLNKKYAGNNLIVGDSAEPRLITELRRGCNIVPSIKGQGSVNYGISLLQDYDLIIEDQEGDLVKELNNYCWLERKSQTPIDAFNHALDALRYAVSYQLQNPNQGQYHIH